MPPISRSLNLCLLADLKSLFLLMSIPWIISWSLVAWIPGRLGQYARRIPLRLFCRRAGKVNVFGKLFIQFPQCVSLGDHVWFGDNCGIGGPGQVTIGSHVAIAHNTYFETANHDLLTMKAIPGDIRIGDNVWIGCRSLILPEVTVGDHAVVAAGSVVTRNVPPYTLVGGVPAKPIKAYDSRKRQWVRIVAE
jgi:acetyltransferase-like isoleucine patch superfamily enzyme